MLNFDYITEEYKKQHNRNWPETPEIGGSGSGKANLIT